MKISLSSIVQWKFNIFVCKVLGWRMAFFYIILLGKLYFYFKRKEKRRIEEAIGTAFSDYDCNQKRKSISKNVFRGILSHYYEKLFNAHENVERLEAFLRDNIEVRCLEKLDVALKEGKGVLFVTGHYGGIEYIPIFLALNKYPISVIAKFATRQLKETLYSKTKDLGLRIIDAGQETSILASVIEELKANRLVFIECDEIKEWKPSRKENILFLGKMIGVDKTISLIQRRTGAQIIFGILHRFTMQKYKLIIESYQDLLVGLGYTTRSVGEAILKSFEQYVYLYPEEWYQWKNYAEIKTPSISGTRVERVSPLSLPKPAFGGAS
jgi:KDO2-lipid IV(A) lauroyltransferase